jgi:hypothetical protein
MVAGCCLANTDVISQLNEIAMEWMCSWSCNAY